MNIEQMLEQRSERGTEAGPANVWFEANQTADRTLRRREIGRKTFIGFATIVAVTATGLMALNFENGDRFEASTATSSATQTKTGNADPNPEPMSGGASDSITERPVRHPAKIAVNLPGFELSRVRPAANRNYVAKDGRQLTVYAESETSYLGPAVIVDSRANGYATLNLNTERNYSADVSRDGDSWKLNPSAGLVEVASFDYEAIDQPYFWQWELTYRDGTRLVKYRDGSGKQATINAVAMGDANSPIGAGEGVWAQLAVSALQTGGIEKSRIEPVEVLGHDGLKIRDANPTNTDRVIWQDDSFAYSLSMEQTFQERDGSYTSLLAASENLGSLVEVDDVTWAQMEANASNNTGEILFQVLRYLVVCVVIVSAVFFARKRSWVPFATIWIVALMLNAALLWTLLAAFIAVIAAWICYQILEFQRRNRSSAQ